MNERITQPVASLPSSSPAPLPAWDTFERALASALSVLQDEFLVVSTKVGNRYVQFNVSPGRGVFVEAVSNAYLGDHEKLDVGQLADLLSLGWSSPTHAPAPEKPATATIGSPNHFREFARPYSCPDVASFAIRTLTGPLRVGSPSELEYRAFDADGRAVTLPALPIDREVRPRPGTKAPPGAKDAGNSKRLRSKVLSAARAASGHGSLTYDEGGSLRIPIGGRTGWIRPFDDPSFVRVYVQLLSEAAGGKAFLSRIHELNSRLPVARVIYTERCVYLGIDFPAVPFRAEHLTQAMALLAQLADKVLEDLTPPGELATTRN